MHVTRSATATRQHCDGFTLVEILIVIALIGIITTVAIPSYNRFIIEIRRGDARHLLEKNAHLLERCLTLRGAYNNACNLWTQSNDQHYTLTSVVTAQTYTITANPIANSTQANDSTCTTLSLNHAGQRTATGSDPDSCW